jgi:hypothetical protein
MVNKKTVVLVLLSIITLFTLVCVIMLSYYGVLILRTIDNVQSNVDFITNNVLSAATEGITQGLKSAVMSIHAKLADTTETQNPNEPARPISVASLFKKLAK